MVQVKPILHICGGGQDPQNKYFSSYKLLVGYHSAIDGSPSLFDMVSVPNQDDYGIITNSSRLFLQYFHGVHLKRPDGDFRLDVWFKHNDPLRSEHDLPDCEGLSLQRTQKVTVDGTEHIVTGSWVQVINLSNQFLGVTIIHELVHLADLYFKAPFGKCSCSEFPEQLEALNQAYAQTSSYRLLDTIVSGNGKIPYVEGSDGNNHFVLSGREATDIIATAEDMLQEHEVFARCVTSLILYEAGSSLTEAESLQFMGIFTQHTKRVLSRRNDTLRYEMDTNDYNIVKEPLLALLKMLEWRPGPLGSF